MPIEKVAVVHKFGIISQSQRLELQERLLKRNYLQTYGTRKPYISSRNPLEVSEEFVEKFNIAETLDEQEKLEHVAYKMLERIKRRAGLKDGGVGGHVELPVAWTELSQLAQCKGKVEEDCLDVLVISLDQAPLSYLHIPALTFLAENTLYWLRTDAMHQPYLRTSELKLLKMGQLVFCRLFYHHMAGQLQGNEEFKNRLYTYLSGLSECQDAYSPYPNALLAIRYMSEVGKMLIGDSTIDAGEIKEGDNFHVHALPSTPESRTESEIASPQEAELFYESTADRDIGHTSTQSGAISSSVHELSPTLWHALDVWRCVSHVAMGLPDAVRALAHCGMRLASENWVDALCAMQVLADAARVNLGVLKVLQNLARGITSRPHTRQTQSGKGGEPVMKLADGGSTGKVTSSKFTMSEVSEHSLERSNLNRATAAHNQTPGSEQIKRARALYSCGSQIEVGTSTPPVTAGLSNNTAVGLQEPQEKDRETCGSVSSTAEQATRGSQHPHSGRASETSSVFTYANAVSQDMPGLLGWHWEVAVIYADIMADLCLHGTTSSIQKVALVGNNKDLSKIHTLAGGPRSPMRSAGLVDLLHFRASAEAYNRDAPDWSWRVRYTAMQGLAKICRCCAGDKTREGLRTVAWNALVSAHSLERDIRVLEALKMGKVDAKIETLLTENTSSRPSTLGGKIAKGLSVLYLPALPPPVEDSVAPKLKSQPKAKRQDAATSRARRPLRTSLREELMLATALYEPPADFNTRTSYDLKRIVEDQWRKDCQQQLEDEKEEKQMELLEKQKQEEQKVVQAEESRRAKLKQGSSILAADHSRKQAGMFRTCSSDVGAKSETAKSNHNEKAASTI